MKPVGGSEVLAMRKLIIAQNEALQKTAAARQSNEASKDAGFSTTMADALKQVNDLQHAAGDATRAYTVGDTTDIASVMLAKQKASIGFEATLQVRNKLLSAYKDIMSMPV